jgi:hypothetical protein
MANQLDFSLGEKPNFGGISFYTQAFPKNLRATLKGRASIYDI